MNTHMMSNPAMQSMASSTVPSAYAHIPIADCGENGNVGITVPANTLRSSRGNNVPLKGTTLRVFSTILTAKIYDHYCETFLCYRILFYMMSIPFFITALHHTVLGIPLSLFTSLPHITPITHLTSLPFPTSLLFSFFHISTSWHFIYLLLLFLPLTYPHLSHHNTTQHNRRARSTRFQ